MHELGYDFFTIPNLTKHEIQRLTDDRIKMNQTKKDKSDAWKIEQIKKLEREENIEKNGKRQSGKN